MHGAYELMDIETGSVVGFYDTEEDALAVVRDTVASYGMRGIEGLVLSRLSDDGSLEAIAEGSALAERAASRDIIRARR